MSFLALANSLTQLFAARILGGIFAANISTAYAFVADLTEKSERTRAMGLIGAGFGMGFVLGPAIGGALSPIGISVPIWFATGLAVANLFWARASLPNLSPPSAQNATQPHRFSKQSWKLVCSLGLTRHAVMMMFFLTFAVTQMEVSFALFMQRRFGFDANHAGMLLAMMGLGMALVQGGLVGRISKRVPELVLTWGGFAIASVALLAFGQSLFLSGSVVALLGLALGHGVLHPSLSSLASKGAPEQHRGVVMGIFQSSSAAARVLGPPCAGWLFDHVDAASPFQFGALMLAIALGIHSYFLFRNGSKLEPIEHH